MTREQLAHLFCEGEKGWEHRWVKEVENGRLKEDLDKRTEVHSEYLLDNRVRLLCHSYGPSMVCYAWEYEVSPVTQEATSG